MNPRLALIILCLAGCTRVDQSVSAESADPYLTSDLVGWWTFDEGRGATVADFSGLGNTAAIRNGGWGIGKNGAALQMNGGDDGVVIVPISESLRSTTREITVMSWTYRTAEHNVAVVAHGYPTLFFGFHGAQFKWQIEQENGRGAACYADRQHQALLHKWIHIAATYDGWRVRLYVDGIEICSQRFWGSIGMPDSPFTFSGYLDESQEIVDEITGRIDEIRIYRRALKEAEIRSVYQHYLE